MYYNSSPPQESAMNLLISPFNPDQMPYFNNSDSNHEINPSEYSPNYSQYSQLSHHNEVLDYNNNEAQAFDLQQQNRFFDMTGMSPVAMPASVSMSTLYNRSPSPSSDSKHPNEFISRSPESSSSAETNLVSPPQYQSSDFSWSTSVALPPTPLEDATSQYNHHPATKRSSSVPPHFHKFKHSQQDSMYNQFQVSHLNHHSMMPPKALPIKIQRFNPSTSQRPVCAETQRRQLDEKLEKVNFDDITVAELKEMLRERGLSATGRKAELMNRLKEEYDLVTCGHVTPLVKQQQQPSTALHRRVANLNIMDSPRQQRLYAPYSPSQRLASSVPNSHTPQYLNDQFMKKPSCLRKSIDHDEIDMSWQPQSYSVSPPSFYHETPAIDLWDDQTLQNFLKQI